MNKVSDIEVFKNNISTLKETSRDDHNGTVSFMTQYLLEVVDFDKVKHNYLKGLKAKVSEEPKSNDALYIGDNDELVFIEFKNGNIDNKQKYGVWQKIYDSLLLLLDILNVGCRYAREHLSYILVYNENRNPAATSQDAQDIKETVQGSPSRTMIEKYVFEQAKEDFIQFGLARFKNLYFKDVYTYNEKEFENNFVQKISK